MQNDLGQDVSAARVADSLHAGRIAPFGEDPKTDFDVLVAPWTLKSNDCVFGAVQVESAWPELEHGLAFASDGGFVGPATKAVCSFVPEWTLVRTFYHVS